MIRIAGSLPSAELRDTLADLQRSVDGAPTWDARVARAKKAWEDEWSEHPHRQIAIASLKEMCTGPERCMYCEDSLAWEIEHFYPKGKYPGKAFDWENLLYACRPCNGPKSVRFDVFDGRGRPARTTLRVEPKPGDPVLIDVRREDPLEYLLLELTTGMYMNLHPERSRSWHRAEAALQIFGLNRRDALRKARAHEYRSKLALLEKYVRTRDPADLEAIARGPHRTVWEEMKRQRELYAELQALFAKAPEALGQR